MEKSKLLAETLAQTAVIVPAQTRPRSARRACLWMIVAGLCVRLAVMAFVYPERLNPARDHWKFAGETGRIARSIVEGQGFGNPFFAETGPTSWLAPVFPATLAGVFKIFGVYTKASALVILSLDCLLGALTCVPVFLIARQTFGESAAVWAGWIWAFFPYSINFSASFIWDTTLSTLLMALLFLYILRLENAPRWWPWFGFGALVGFAALTDPVLLGVMPFLTLWMLYRYWKRGERWFAPGAAALLAVIIVVSPWFVRNYRTFHEFIPIRANFWAEVYCGNTAGSADWSTDIRPPGYHPSDSAREWSKYQQLGETKYFALKKREALAFISVHKKLYAMQTLRRVVYIWTGFWSFSRRYLQQEPFDPENIVFCTALSVLAFLGLRRARLGGQAWREAEASRAPGRTGAMPFVIVFVIFPLVYYLTHVEEYYRSPMDPLLVALAAGAIATWRNRKTAKAGPSPSSAKSAAGFGMTA